MLKQVKVTWGSDPEGFFKSEDRIIGSEKLIPKKGYGTPHGRITRDGVQFELHPTPGTIRELCRNVGGLLIAANGLARDDGFQLHYGTLVDVQRDEILSLSPASQQLGCMPSYNIYGEKPITVDPATYLKRSAAGHIHIGLGNKDLMRYREKLVWLMDILAGNTCVLLDRDPGAGERRENYGRAGECRFPKHGVEYRTISSFWLRDPALMRFVFGLAEIAVSVLAESVLGDGKTWELLRDRSDIGDVRKAIDTNDFGLALRNFNNIAPVLRDALPRDTFVLDNARIGMLVNLSINVNRNGLDSIFPIKNLVTRWRKGANADLLQAA